MKIAFKCRFPDGKRMERVIRTQEDIQQVREDFVTGYKECLAGDFRRIRLQKVSDGDFGPNGCFVETGAVHINCGPISAAGSWCVNNPGDVEIAGAELDMELTRFLFLWTRYLNDPGSHSYRFGDLQCRVAA